MRKIRVMLVDDESAIRNILKLSVHWDNFHMEIAGEADSGSEAINSIDLIEPDILIVDIKMPFMNGIEFSKIVSERYPTMRILILSAYADFAYAKECIEIKNVIGYLLKPVNPKELEEHLKVYYEQVKKMDFPSESGRIRKEKKQNTDQLAWRIDKYIQENYRNAYLNVGGIAEAFGYNANYLSSLYKKQTGQSLSDKIFSVRMEEAKNMRKQGMKMYMVAKEVGIADPFYFSKCFRKYTGCSFSDYKEDE